MGNVLCYLLTRSTFSGQHWPIFWNLTQRDSLTIWPDQKF